MNIYVGRLAPITTEDQIKSLFEEYGEVSSVKLIKDKLTGSPRGFAFVEMPSSDQANQAIAEVNGKELDGSRLVVNEARPPQDRPARSRFGGPSSSDRGPRRPSNGGGSRDFGGNRGGSSRW